MGFLDKLQDVGFGNRGPYGRQMSGATYFSNTVQDRLGQETFKGVESAITQAAGAGPITFDKQVEIAEKWGVPLRDITARSVDVNKMYEQKRQAKFLHTFWGMFQKKKQMEPEWKPDEEWIRNAIRESKGTGSEDFALAVGAMKKVRGQQRMINMKAGDTLTDVSTTIDGKIKATPVFTAEEREKKPDDKWEDSIEYYGGNQIRISRNKTTGEVKHKVISKTDGAGKKDGIMKEAYNQWKSIPGNEKIMLVDFKKLWEAKDPITAALALAGRDPLVQFGGKDVGERAKEYLDAMAQLKGYIEGHKGGVSDLPTGLTEPDIEFNMKKYGKTRAEVIAKFKSARK